MDNKYKATARESSPKESVLKIGRDQYTRHDFIKKGAIPMPNDGIKDDEDSCLTCIHQGYTCHGEDVVGGKCQNCRGGVDGNRKKRDCLWQNPSKNVWTYRQAQAVMNTRRIPKNTVSGKAEKVSQKSSTRQPEEDETDPELEEVVRAGTVQDEDAEDQIDPSKFYSTANHEMVNETGVAGDIQMDKSDQDDSEGDNSVGSQKHELEDRPTWTVVPQQRQRMESWYNSRRHVQCLKDLCKYLYEVENCSGTAELNNIKLMHYICSLLATVETNPLYAEVNKDVVRTTLLELKYTLQQTTNREEYLTNVGVFQLMNLPLPP